MQYSGRPRRFRKIHAARVAADQNLITAGQLMTGAGFDHVGAERYAAQITRVAGQLGAAAADHTYAKHGARPRSVSAYDISRDALALVVALGTYRPSLSATVTKTGKPSNSKAAQKQRAAHAAYTRPFMARAIAATVRAELAA